MRLYQRTAMPLRRILMFIILLVLLCAAFLITLLFRYIQQVEEDSYRQYEHSSQTFVSSISSTIGTYQQAMGFISLNQSIRDNIFRMDVSEMEMVDLSSQLTKTIDSMTYYLYQNGEIYRHCLYTYLPTDGKYFWNISTLPEEIIMVNPDGAEPVTYISYSNMTKSYHLIFCQAINTYGTDYWPYRGNQYCYQVMDVDIEALIRRCLGQSAGAKMEVFVVDHAGDRLIYSGNEELDDSALEAFHQVQNGTPSAELEEIPWTEEHAAYYIPIVSRIGNMDYSVVMLFPPTELVIQGDLAEWKVVVVNISLILFALTILLLCYVVYTMRMNWVITKIDAFDNEAEGSVEEIRGKDEISRIDRHVSAMQKRIHKLIRDEYQAKMQAIHAQNESLLVCINPHFLYNTLNTISAMAGLEGAETSVEMIAALSDMFRYTSDLNTKFVPLERELQNIRDYLKIQSLRWQNSFSYQIEADNDVQGLEVPKLILQPIVENCFKHGFGKNFGKKDKRLRITVSKEENDLVIQVEDNGQGMTAEKLAEVRQKLSTGDAGDGDGNIGLYTVQRRLRLLYGEDSGLCLSSEEGEYTRINIVLKDNLRRNRHAENSGGR